MKLFDIDEIEDAVILMVIIGSILWATGYWNV